MNFWTVYAKMCLSKSTRQVDSLAWIPGCGRSRSRDSECEADAQGVSAGRGGGCRANGVLQRVGKILQHDSLQQRSVLFRGPGGHRLGACVRLQPRDPRIAYRYWRREGQGFLTGCPSPGHPRRSCCGRQRNGTGDILQGVATLVHTFTTALVGSIPSLVAVKNS